MLTGGVRLIGHSLFEAGDNFQGVVTVRRKNENMQRIISGRACPSPLDEAYPLQPSEGTRQGADSIEPVAVTCLPRPAEEEP